VGKRVLLLVVAAFITLTVSMEAAQSSSATAASDRKVTSKVAPVYPELAKRMHLHGTVRVEAVVRPNGAVKTTRVLGGNPVLVDAALDAVGKWKFEPAQAETTEVVQVTFDAE
jgi:TonB family protein